MPVVDMPLEKLRKYTGTNAKPDDFDSYWERALAELAGIDPEPEIRTSTFSSPTARCDDLYFTGTRGARIHAKLVRPGEDVPVPNRGQQPADSEASGSVAGRPAVLRFHGYTMDAGDWTDHLALAGAGFVVAGMDCRGQGGSSEDPGGVRGNTQHGHIIRGLDDGPEHLLYRHIFLDTVQLFRVVAGLDEVDSNRIGATGGSQGGALTLACAALEPRVKRAAAVFPFLSDYKRVWDMDLDDRAYRELRDYFRHADPRHERAEEVFRILGYIDVHHLAPRIRADTVMLITLIDEVCPPSTQFAAYNNLRCPKRAVLYPDFGHERLPGGDDEVFTHMQGL